MVEAVDEAVDAFEEVIVFGGSGDEGNVICRQGMWGCLLVIGEF